MQRTYGILIARKIQLECHEAKIRIPCFGTWVGWLRGANALQLHKRLANTKSTSKTKIRLNKTKKIQTNPKLRKTQRACILNMLQSQETDKQNGESC